MEVKLSQDDVLDAVRVAVLREFQNVGVGRKDRYGASAEFATGLALHIQDALGECALAKLLGATWTGNLGRLDLPDVGLLQARTVTKEGHRLILHPEDRDDVFVLVVLHAISEDGVLCTFPGWIRAQDGKSDKWKSDPSKQGRPAYFVPLSALHPVEQLREAMWLWRKGLSSS